MKKSREQLNRYFELALQENVADVKVAREIVQKCYQRYGIPPVRSQTIIQLDASSMELRDCEIYWVLKCIQEVCGNSNLKPEIYFTDYEMESYEKMKYSAQKTSFPIILDMIQITDDQYVGKIKASTLVKWRSEGLIRYNKVLQRRLTTIVRGGKAYEVITLNSKSVTEMVGCFKRGEFVPNAITLNISEDEMDFFYDGDKHQLVIQSVNHLDLTDGYHRLVALSKVIESDPSFDYDMELRITNFSEAKAGHFIGQEEKHVPIPKRDIRSFDMNDISNKVVRKINDTPMCNMTGAIIRGGRVDFAAFAEMVEELYIKPMSDDEVKKAIITVPKDLIESINIVTENDSSLLDKKFSVMEVRIFVFVCSLFKGKEKSGLPGMMGKMLTHKYSSNEKQMLSSKRKISKVVSHLEEIAKEEGMV